VHVPKVAWALSSFLQKLHCLFGRF
jgi:hypothetical protein